MPQIFTCDECRVFQCHIGDLKDKLDFRSYTLECPLKQKLYGFFVLDEERHRFDVIPKDAKL